jgi:choline dehydrogenase-like flavoprotein
MAGHLPDHGQGAWDLMSRYNNMVLSGALVEDSSSGRVTRGPFGLALAKYQITPYDHARFLKGARLLSELHFTMGAERVVLPFANAHYADSLDEANRICDAQTKLKELELFTVHIMGTARMGAKPEDSVIDLDGQVWDLPGCYVADASVFPTAIGVNPQITIMAIATRIATRLADKVLAMKRAA